MYKYKKKGGATIGWWFVGVLPILNWYWIYRVSKIIANLEEE